MKPGDLVRVKNYFWNAEQGPWSTHGIVIEVEDTESMLDLGRKSPIIKVLIADGFFNHYSAQMLEVIDEAG